MASGKDGGGSIDISSTEATAGDRTNGDSSTNRSARLRNRSKHPSFPFFARPELAITLEMEGWVGFRHDLVSNMFIVRHASLFHPDPPPSPIFGEGVRFLFRVFKRYRILESGGEKIRAALRYGNHGTRKGGGHRTCDTFYACRSRVFFAMSILLIKGLRRKQQKSQKGLIVL